MKSETEPLKPLETNDEHTDATPTVFPRLMLSSF